MIDATILFNKMLTAMVGEEEMADLLNWHEDNHGYNCGCPDCYIPDEWGLDDDDLAQARIDYGSEILF